MMMPADQRIDGSSYLATDRPMPKDADYNRLGFSVNRSLLPKVNGWFECAQNWWFPPVCVLCGDDGEERRDLCRGCADDLPFVKVVCVQCGAPLPMPGTCGHCQRRAPAFDRTVAAFHYASPLDALIKRLKFNGELSLARLLGELMAERFGEFETDSPDVIVPVPLHVQRLKERGFNQALELARPIAERLGVPLAWRHVARIRATDPQADLPAKLRYRNIKGAFAVAPGFAARHVAIVDDVMTTGYTVNELAATLRRAGVATVSVWVCARAALGR